ncbi:endonuclease/exonuclease/phosphatase family protein [Microbacterium aurantiacum]|uniref:Endonuclease/exonuclease/phosphatase family protein n=1 Tax=Microbacterium aurantiacum TaxID=162393 RepID=A0AAJ2LYQ2_9MICO|nr:endonuclease/exonuclease/phosphatase family protein [Microbacterium aurantiacum]MDS0244509.1 endonuclease/exonuclease/phosphatase family protein [Microbacterium aurantiacum]
MENTKADPARPRSGRRVAWTMFAITVSAAAAVLPHLEIRGVAAIPVAQALVPVGAVGILVLAGVSLVLRSWTAAAAFALGAVISVIPTLTPVHTGAGADCETDSSATILSFNAKFADADPAALSDLIRDTEPIAVVLLETSEPLIDAVLIEHGLGDALPHRSREVSPGPASGSVILSAYPLSDEEDVPGSAFDQVSAVAAVPGAGDVRIAAVHPPPPVWQPNAWRDGLDDIADWVRDTPDDTLIVTGDFNASFAHPALRRLASGLRSGAEAAGPIPWPTWPEEKVVPAFTAIDHVFARGAVPLGWRTIAVEGSDHRAVIAEWGLCTGHADPAP